MHELKKHNLPSLRSRYLILASFVTAILLTGAAISSWYINDVSNKNSQAIIIYKKIESHAHELTNALNQVNSVLTAMLIQPEDIHEKLIKDYLHQAKGLILSLHNNSAIISKDLVKSIEKLSNLISVLDKKTSFLIFQRKSPDWVYPILPYINSKLLIPNRSFLSATDLAINEYLTDKLKLDNTYNQLQELRNLWQKKTLNFRAVIVRFAGLNTKEPMLQEAKIYDLNTEINNILSLLKKKQTDDALELQTDASLNIMISSANEWFTQWKNVQKIRESNYWRNDIAYLKKEIIPLQEEVYLDIKILETTVSEWSQQQSNNLTNAAQQIITEIWLLVLLAISFVIIVYIMIEKFVLQPTLRIAKALKEESQEEFFSLEDKSSKEIFELTNAFNNMRKQIHQRQTALEHQAMHDALTGLANRVLFNDRLNQAIHIMERSDEKLAVLLLDLDRFKEVNDTLGHHIGDELLQLVSKRLEETIRDSDTVARLGGDEFAIIAANTSPISAEKFALKINNALKDVFSINHHKLYIGASIGISIYPDNGTDCHTLTRHADTAMYTAKYNNLGTTLYHSSQDKNSLDNLSLFGDLHHAIKDGQIHGLNMHYQPQIDLLTNEVTQIEALLRWEHPVKGFISPEEIINLAEQTGVIQDLTSWVLDTAMKEYMQRIYKHNIHLSINLSTWNLQDPDLPDTINMLLSRHNMPPHMLTLEITESAMMNNPVNARKVLHELNEMGIILSVDDFGTGFSSLSYLKLLPVHELKIDKSFIFEMLENDNDAIIVKSTIELAHNLGYKVIAEGVENNDILLALKSLKCDYIQGYYISRPIDIFKLVYWLHDYKLKMAE